MTGGKGISMGSISMGKTGESAKDTKKNSRGSKNKSRHEGSLKYLKEMI